MSLTDIPQDVIKLIYFNYLAEKDIFSLRSVCKLIHDYVSTKIIYYNPEFQGQLMIQINQSYECRFINSGKKSIIIVGLTYKFNFYFRCSNSYGCAQRDMRLNKYLQVYAIGNHVINTNVIIKKNDHLVDKIYNIQITIN
jgi:hypothetical protein